MRNFRSAEAVDIALIEKTMAGGLRLLRFPPELERYFEAETSHKRCRQLVARGFIALLIFDVFLFADAGVLHDVLPLALFLRLGVVTPIAIILSIVVWFEPAAWLRETIQGVGSVMASAATLGLMLLSSAPYRQAEHYAIILVVLFATVVQRIRFPYALAACAVCFALHFASLAVVPGYPGELELLANMVLGGGVVLALIAAYTLERESRLNYLGSLRDRLLNRELATLSRHDPLTGLCNRRALDELLGDLERQATGVKPLAVLLLDIDHFKLYNDSVGHQGGDVCLKRIAGVLRGELREQGDLAFRFGGEEFLLVVPDADLPVVLTLAERVRRSIEEAAIPHPGLSANSGVVTVSIGAAAALLGADMRATEIIASADAALYAAKRNGRNQVWPPFLSVRPAEIVTLTRKTVAN